MSIATKAAACTNCGKRLNRKSWFYRNNKYFCKRRCWDAEQEKLAKESPQADAKPQGEAEGKAEAKAA